MEKPLDWFAEAESVIDSEKSLVSRIDISPLIVSNGVHLNIETLENQRFCVLLNNQGFRIVARAFDQDTDASQICYETHSALLSNISKSYSQRFNELVFAKLNEFAESCQDQDNKKAES